MNYNILKYLIGEGFKSVLKNKKSTFAAIIIMFATMLTVGLGVAGGKNISAIIDQLQGSFPIQVFIEDSATQSDIKNMEDSIKSMQYVNKVEYKSKADALKDRRENLSNSDVILKDYTDSNNPFPASFTITLTDLTKSNEVISNIQGLKDIKKITTQQSTIGKLNNIKKGVRIGFMIAGALLIFISITIIGNTIKLAVQARKKEISIMKYVGATNNFIRAPFVVEGIVIGIMATAISLIILGGIYVLVYTKCNGALFNYNLLKFNNIFCDELIIFAILGIGIGILGSMLSMKKYLKV